MNQALNAAIRGYEVNPSGIGSFLLDSRLSRRYPVLRTPAGGWHLGRLWPWTSVAAVVFLLAAWLRPSALHPLNLVWLKLGLILHRVVNPIVMGLLFYGTIYPTGLAMRMRGRDLLRLKRDPSADSYWIARPPGPAPETMKDQF